MSDQVVWRIKITLLNVSPVVWRLIEVDPGLTLAQLHPVIQGAMGWDMAHLFSFHLRSRQSELSSSLSLSGVARPGGDFYYAYDFGDDWVHHLKIEEALPVAAGVKYPRCTGGKNACPPEDCGGVGGYADLVRTLRGRGPRRRDLVDWLGGPFDPKRFSVKEANERIAEYVQPG